MWSLGWGWGCPAQVPFQELGLAFLPSLEPQETLLTQGEGDGHLWTRGGSMVHPSEYSPAFLWASLFRVTPGIASLVSSFPGALGPSSLLNRPDFLDNQARGPTP